MHEYICRSISAVGRPGLFTEPHGTCSGLARQTLSGRRACLVTSSRGVRCLGPYNHFVETEAPGCKSDETDGSALGGLPGVDALGDQDCFRLRDCEFPLVHGNHDRYSQTETEGDTAASGDQGILRPLDGFLWRCLCYALFSSPKIWSGSKALKIGSSTLS